MDKLKYFNHQRNGIGYILSVSFDSFQQHIQQQYIQRYKDAK